jgi:hypothetical protein
VRVEIYFRRFVYLRLQSQHFQCNSSPFCCPSLYLGMLKELNLISELYRTVLCFQEMVSDLYSSSARQECILKSVHLVWTLHGAEWRPMRRRSADANLDSYFGHHRCFVKYRPNRIKTTLRSILSMRNVRR